MSYKNKINPIKSKSLNRLTLKLLFITSNKVGVYILHVSSSPQNRIDNLKNKHVINLLKTPPTTILNYQKNKNIRTKNHDQKRKKN